MGEFFLGHSLTIIKLRRSFLEFRTKEQANRDKQVLSLNQSYFKTFKTKLIHMKAIAKVYFQFFFHLIYSRIQAIQKLKGAIFSD